MTNFSFLACLEVAEKFMGVVGGGGGLAVDNRSNLNPSYKRVSLSRVGFGWVGF